jgi:sortase A
MAATLALAACGGGSGSSATTTTVVEDPIPRTTLPAATTTPATVATTTIPITAAAATTAAPTTLPTPIAPPAEDAKEALDDIGHIEIPKLDVSADLFEGIALSTLDRGPGHWPGTALPGQVGNVVVAGHRTSHSKPFRNIDKLDEGDVVAFTLNGATYNYVVTGHEIVDPTAIQIVDQTPEPTATLFACHPPGSVAERYVVHLKLQT